MQLRLLPNKKASLNSVPTVQRHPTAVATTAAIQQHQRHKSICSHVWSLSVEFAY